MKHIREFTNKYNSKIVGTIICFLIALLPALAPYGNSFSVATLIISAIVIYMLITLPFIIRREGFIVSLPILVILLFNIRGFVLNKFLLVAFIYICVIYFVSYISITRSLSKIVKYLSLIFACIVILQTAVYYIFGYHIPFMIARFCLPNLEASYYRLIETGVSGNVYRPSAIFLEPSNLAQYCFVGLLLCLFRPNKKNIIFAIIISLGIICTTSGIGIVIALISWGLFIIYYLIFGKKKVKILVLIVVAVVAVIIAGAYMFVPAAKYAIQRIIDGNAIGGRLFWYRVYFRNKTPLFFIFGSGPSTLPENIYFTGLMEIIWSCGIIGLLMVFTYIYLSSNHINICGLVLSISIFMLQLFANNINLPFMFFAISVALLEKDSMYELKPNKKPYFITTNYGKPVKDFVCSEDICTGCGVCSLRCPRNSIKMEKDIYGFLRPHIDGSTCINCGLCSNVCPANSGNDLHEPIKCYAMSVKDEFKSKLSTSGGVASLIASRIISNGGVFYGAAHDESTQSFAYIRAEKNSDLSTLSGSKYTQVYLNDSYSLCKKDLDNGTKVAFIGTPCYVNGLKRYLGKEYENLLLIDLVCHGVPSQKMLDDHLKNNFVKRKNRIIKNITFRKGKDYLLRIIDSNDKVVYEGDFYKDSYIEAFCKSMSMRESCYNCRYADIKRCGDLTLGDFWGISESSTMFKDKNKGLSMCLVNTRKGSNFVETILDNCNFDQREIEEARIGNAQLKRPTLISYDALKLRRIYPERSFDTAVKEIRNNKQYIIRLAPFRAIIKFIKNKRLKSKHN